MRGRPTIAAVDGSTLAMTLSRAEDRVVLLVVRIAGTGNVTLDESLHDGRYRDWRVIMTTEDAEFVPGGHTPAIADTAPPTIAFSGAAAVVLEGRLDPASLRTGSC